jgi:hypothetical protein
MLIIGCLLRKEVLGRIEVAVAIELKDRTVELVCVFEIDRSSRPSSMPAAVIQALIPCLTQIGMATCGCAGPCLEVG